MAKASVNDAWDRANAFTRAEWRLLAPVGLLLYGLPYVVLRLAVTDVDVQAMQQTGVLPTGSWLILPVLLLWTGATLAISALALVPRITVGEGLRLAGRGVPVMLGVVGLGVIAMFVYGVLVSILLFGLIGPGAGTSAASLAVLPALAVFTILFSLVAPMAVTQRIGPLAAVRRAWRLSSGGRWRILAVLLAFMVVSAILNLAITSIVGVVALPLSRAAGMPQLGELAVVLAAALASTIIWVLSCVWTAEFYRALVSAPSVPRSGI